MNKYLIIILCLIINFHSANIIASESKNEIVLGIVDSKTSPSLFKEGIHLATSSLNQAGGTLGKKWRVIFYDDENSPKKGQAIAETLCSNPDIFAIIGHRHPEVALSASIVYKDEKKLFISPGADINLYGGTYLFRHGPGDKTKASKIASYAYENNYHKVIIFNYFDAYEKVFADLFAKQANDKNINIVSRKSFSSWDQNFAPMISDAVNCGPFDAIFLSGSLPLSGYLIQQIREMGIMVPILGSDNLDSSSLSIIAGKAAENTIVPTIFDPTNPIKKTEYFVDEFQSKYGMVPDTWAAMGFDTVKLLADMIEKSQSCDPVVIDNNLRFQKQWEGVVGAYSLLQNGMIIPQSYFFKRFRNGGFEFPKRIIKEDQFELIREFTLCLPVQPEIKTLDPSLVKNPGLQNMFNLIFLGLTGFDRKNKLIPMLASSWDHKDNFKMYTFQIRKEARWSDHTPVTANDIVETLKRNIQNSSSCPYARLLYALKNGQAIHTGKMKQLSDLGVVAKDNFTVEFILERPLAYFPELLSHPVFWPLPSKLIKDKPDNWTLLKNITTSGPYKLCFYEPDYLLIFRKNEAFFNQQDINIPEVRFYVIPDGILGLDHFVNNKLDALPQYLLQVPKDQLPLIRSHPRLRKEYNQFVGDTIYSINFNIHLPPVDDKLIRQAIMASIDTNRLTSIITGRGEYPVCTLVPPNNPANLGGCLRFKPKEAKKRLNEAGYPGGLFFPKLLISYEDSEEDHKIAKGLAKIIHKNINVHVQLTENKNQAHINLVKRKASYYSGEYFDHLFYLDPLHEGLFKSYNEFQETYKQLMLEKNAQKVLYLIKKAENILINKEAVVMPLFVTCQHTLIHPRVIGWKNRFQGQHHLWQWSLRKIKN
ncbi:peptide ABC transporter substrate-binding protein [Candidatus Magnetomorum sp. HK-1]|nr:peptide ABC transporter substrate-binding protein [Candidatus Magnetomorum sp. HK-1]